ncbi:hypothetical protein ACFL43_02920 [Thermodesulfobacteriota bacterium]
MAIKNQYNKVGMVTLKIDASAVSVKGKDKLEFTNIINKKGIRALPHNPFSIKLLRFATLIQQYMKTIEDGSIVIISPNSIPEKSISKYLNKLHFKLIILFRIFRVMLIETKSPKKLNTRKIK